MKTLIRSLLIILFGIVLIPAAILLFINSKLRRKARPPRAVTDEDIARAEKRLGFGFPVDLRSHFLGKTRTKRHCVSLYALAAAVDEYRMLTKRPYGPEGQDWPKSYFPVADLLPGYALYDLESRLIVEWDPEELGEEEDRPDLWDKSFTETSMGLEEWLRTPEAPPRPAQTPV